MKKYLCFITQDGNRDHVLELTKNYDFFDGIFAVVHKGDRSDDTLEILEQRKKDGAINTLDSYFMRHDLSMNINLLNPKIKNGDWIFLLDTLERINQDFYPEIDPLLEFFEEQKMLSISFEGKLFFFKKYYDQLFVQSPHWYLSNPVCEIPIELTQLNGKIFEKARINLRPQYRQHDHEIDHFVKYLWEFRESNHGVMECDKYRKHNSDIKMNNHEFNELFKDFEITRRLARDYAVDHGIPTDTLEFSNWLIVNKNNYPSQILDLLKHKCAMCFRNFYRYHVLKEGFETIKETQFEWEFND